MRRIDEACPRHTDAIRISNDQIRSITGHFHVAAQVRGIGRSDLIDDHLRGLARLIVRITREVAAEQRRRDVGRVIENQALLVDVELRVLVMRHTRR